MIPSLLNNITKSTRPSSVRSKRSRNPATVTTCEYACCQTLPRCEGAGPQTRVTLCFRKVKSFKLIYLFIYIISQSIYRSQIIIVSLFSDCNAVPSQAPSIYNIHLKKIPTNLNNTVVSNLIKKVNLSILYKNLEL